MRDVFGFLTEFVYEKKIIMCVINNAGILLPLVHL